MKLLFSVKHGIIYMGSFGFPLGDAVAKRALGIGLSLENKYDEIVFIGEDDSVPRNCISEKKKYGKFSYYNIHKPQSSREHLEYRRDAKTVCELLDKLSGEMSIDAFIFCGMKCSFLAAKIIKHCRKKGIQTIADSMDWLSANSNSLLYNIIKQTDINYELRHVNMKSDKLIVISTFLRDFYSERGKKTIVIPPLSPYEPISEPGKRNGFPKLIYAGIPCRLGKELKDKSSAKDRLDLAVEYLYEAHIKGIGFVFDIYGMDKEQYITVYPCQRKIVEELTEAGKLKYHGYTDEKSIREAYIIADYMVLLREKNRTSIAGFPTKVSESTSLGVPVITTDTSDISEYLTDGRNCYFVDIENRDAAVDKICDILTKSDEEQINMHREVARLDAFRPARYSDKLFSFIEEG